MKLDDYKDHNGNSLAGTVEHLTEKLVKHNLAFVLVLVDPKTADVHTVSNSNPRNIPNALESFAKDLRAQLGPENVDPLQVSGMQQ